MFSHQPDLPCLSERPVGGAPILKFPVDFPEPGLSCGLSCTRGLLSGHLPEGLDPSALSDVSLRALDMLVPQDPDYGHLRCAEDRFLGLPGCQMLVFARLFRCGSAALLLSVFGPSLVSSAAH